jgi:hypothetical protein
MPIPGKCHEDVRGKQEKDWKHCGRGNKLHDKPEWRSQIAVQ